MLACPALAASPDTTDLYLAFRFDLHIALLCID